MRMFASRDDRHQREAGRGAGREGRLSIIAAGTRIVGEIECDGVIKVEGIVEGTVRAARQVLVAREGLIAGDVFSAEAVVGGRVAGSILAEARVEVQPDAVVRGDIVTQRLVVQEGGEVNGNIQMGSADPHARTRQRSHRDSDPAAEAAALERSEMS